VRRTATRWTTADIPSQTGRTVVVTGANSGLGLETARALAAAGTRVVLAVRDRTRGEQAAATLRGDVEVRSPDLADLTSPTGSSPSPPGCTATARSSWTT
jgi:NAD(P)-dependent dehydrogenase (short-subunit alcohol dehydrogenase family)